MSSYICLYGRAKSNSGPYFCLNSWSRSSVMYQTLKSIVPYGETTPLTTDKLTSCVKIATDELEEHCEQLATARNRLDFLKSAQLSYEDLNKAYYDYQNEADEIHDTIDEIQSTIAEMRTIIDMVDFSKYDEEGLDYYLAYETDPNHPETE